ncbi:hypothetical protein HXX76_006123 [Chlamydomonas incerta]|uniref:Extradiol ring-cleavage dioxygenase class III enzyme subunit B domain-containing protein n=1 Tax=Chlamydomonas incerta TaxID=51695 RepID=A0A835W4Y0_CHLIN|nr:hypothetical protein HXX76_006123 [Chlamydomonas incerta]|eukprot:KAG2437473.1 hypothetical protein HXX76_006123 [Chlamydomonas incerta]
MTVLAQQCAASGRMPTLFWNHGGGPMPLLGDRSQASLTQYLKTVAARLPKPTAIVAVSAHWEADKVMVSTCPAPPMLYDYYGFPPESYEFKYAAPGDPQLAQRVLGLLGGAGIAAAADATRGYDHGTFVPLMLAYPEARIPVVQMSVLRSMDPGAHLAIGRALAPLRDEGVLIVGSGMAFHNMGVLMGGMRGGGGRYKPSEAFDSWLTAACTEAVGAKRAELLSGWAKAPGGRESHPREEHLIPLLVAAGAAGEEPGRADYSDWIMGTKVSGFVFGAAS